MAKLVDLTPYPCILVPAKSRIDGVVLLLMQKMDKVTHDLAYCWHDATKIEWKGCQLNLRRLKILAEKVNFSFGIFSEAGRGDRNGETDTIFCALTFGRSSLRTEWQWLMALRLAFESLNLVSLRQNCPFFHFTVKLEVFNKDVRIAL